MSTQAPKANDETTVGSIAGGYMRDFDEPLPRSDKPPPVAEPIEEEKPVHKQAPT